MLTCICKKKIKDKKRYKKKLIAFILFLLKVLLNTHIYSQECIITNNCVRIIKIYEGFDVDGAIFPASLKVLGIMDTLKNAKRITPSVKDVLTAEDIVLTYIEEENKDKANKIKDYKIKLKNNYYRQYWAYELEDKSIVLAIHYMNFNNAPELYFGWYWGFKLGFGPPLNKKGYEYNSRIAWVNITKKERFETDFPLHWN